MTPDTARSLLNRAALDTTIRTLVAMDCLQGLFYREHVEPHLKHVKRDDSIEWGMAERALKGFVIQCPSGNNQAVRMNSSAFIAGLRMLDMEREVEFSLELCKSLNDDEP